jgi:4-alpha-glucanotransferase
MNQPGTPKGAWKWRLSELPSHDLAKRLREATSAAGRLGG